MKNLVFCFMLAIMITSCNHNQSISDKKIVKRQPIEGSWKMIYADIRENDTIQIKDLSNTDFIKIINESHFAFINQVRDTSAGFFAGAGTYSYKEGKYVESLDFIDAMSYRGHQFEFTVQFSGDTLIQKGREHIEEAGIDRYITEKYIRISKQK